MLMDAPLFVRIYNDTFVKKNQGKVFITTSVISIQVCVAENSGY